MYIFIYFVSMVILAQAEAQPLCVQDICVGDEIYFEQRRNQFVQDRVVGFIASQNQVVTAGAGAKPFDQIFITNPAYCIADQLICPGAKDLHLRQGEWNAFWAPVEIAAIRWPMSSQEVLTRRDGNALQLNRIENIFVSGCLFDFCPGQKIWFIERLQGAAIPFEGEVQYISPVGRSVVLRLNSGHRLVEKNIGDEGFFISEGCLNDFICVGETFGLLSEFPSQKPIMIEIKSFSSDKGYLTYQAEGSNAGQTQLLNQRDFRRLFSLEDCIDGQSNCIGDVLDLNNFFEDTIFGAEFINRGVQIVGRSVNDPIRVFVVKDQAGRYRYMSEDAIKQAEMVSQGCAIVTSRPGHFLGGIDLLTGESMLKRFSVCVGEVATILVDDAWLRQIKLRNRSWRRFGAPSLEIPEGRYQVKITHVGKIAHQLYLSEKPKGCSDFERFYKVEELQSESSDTQSECAKSEAVSSAQSLFAEFVNQQGVKYRFSLRGDFHNLFFEQKKRRPCRFSDPRCTQLKALMEAKEGSSEVLLGNLSGLLARNLQSDEIKVFANSLRGPNFYLSEAICSHFKDDRENDEGRKICVGDQVELKNAFGINHPVDVAGIMPTWRLKAWPRPLLPIKIVNQGSVFDVNIKDLVFENP